MTITKILKQIDERKPNSYSRDQKIDWINELEEAVQLFLGLDRSDWVRYDADSLDEETVISSPHDRLYVLWLKCKIDFDNEEYESYGNQQAQFDADLTEWKKFALRSGLVNSPVIRYKNVF